MLKIHYAIALAGLFASYTIAAPLCEQSITSDQFDGLHKRLDNRLGNLLAMSQGLISASLNDSAAGRDSQTILNVANDVNLVLALANSADDVLGLRDAMVNDADRRRTNEVLTRALRLLQRTAGRSAESSNKALVLMRSPAAIAEISHVRDEFANISDRLAQCAPRARQ